MFLTRIFDANRPAYSRVPIYIGAASQHAPERVFVNFTIHGNGKSIYFSDQRHGMCFVTMAGAKGRGEDDGAAWTWLCQAGGLGAASGDGLSRLRRNSQSDGIVTACRVSLCGYDPGGLRWERAGANAAALQISSGHNLWRLDEGALACETAADARAH